jgi:thioredoxin 1
VCAVEAVAVTTPRRRLWLVALVAMSAASGAWWSAHRRGEANVVAVDLQSGRPKLFDFGMDVCEQCRNMKPVMQRASRELGDDIDVHVLDIRDPRNERLAERYRVRVIPLIVLADGAGKELWRHEGYLDFPEISRVVAERLVRP